MRLSVSHAPTTSSGIGSSFSDFFVIGPFPASFGFASTRMQNFSEKPQNIFQTKGHAGNGPRTKKPERELPMPELSLSLMILETESLIGNYPYPYPYPGFRPYGLGKYGN